MDGLHSTMLTEAHHGVYGVYWVYVALHSPQTLSDEPHSSIAQGETAHPNSWSIVKSHCKV